MTSTQEVKSLISQPENPAILDGIPVVEGSVVVSDFFANEADIQRRVTKIKTWSGSSNVQVSTDGGREGRGRPLSDVDLQAWIRWPKTKTQL